MTALKREFFLMILNWLMYPLYSNKIVVKKKIIDRSVHYHTWQRLTGSFSKKLYFHDYKFSPYNAHYSFLKMIEIWKNYFDKRDRIGVILMDLSKPFDTINHRLILAKRDAYSFSRTS